MSAPSSSAPVPGLDFTAIDFETANGFRGSPCSVGVVRVRAGAMVERASWMMRPPLGFDRFDPRNVRIHGITADQVADAPRFAEVYTQLRAFCGEDVLVAHNAGFDVGVIESALEVSDVDVPPLEYACTLMLARKAYDLPSYALPSASRAAGFVPGRHHEALADAEACAAILIDVGRRTLEADGGPVELRRVLRAHGLQTGRLLGHPHGQGRESRPTRQARDMADVFDARVPLRSDRAMPDFMRWPEEGVNTPANRDAPRDSPLYGHVVVFTGGIGMSRQEAKDRAAALGAQPSSRVGAHTTMLVVGDGFSAEDILLTAREADGAGAPARGAGRVTTTALAHRKTRDALRRRASGQQIALVSEPEFLQMLGDNWPQGAR